MDSSILGTVIEVEREIQARIDAEQKRARAGIEQVKAEAERSVAREAELIEAALAQALADSRAAAIARSADIANRTRQQAAQMAGLSDALLHEVLARSLRKILPGEDGYDRPDVEG